MSTSRGSGSGNGGGVQPIPAGSRKMVQSLKEIVNCSDAEIYAALKECNMDPNEAVNRLLSQDPFHEVKSKREKKKEGKDTDSRSRGSSNNISRGNKSAADRYGGRGSTAHNLPESGPRPVKASHKKENGSTPYIASLSSALGMSGNNRSRGLTGLSNGTYAENEGSLLGTDDVMPVGIQPSSRYQTAWNVAPGQVSMADIVKRGRPHSMTSNAPKASNSNVVVPPSNSSHDNLRFPEDQASRDPDSIVSSIEQLPTHDEWPIIEKPVPTKVISMPEVVHFEKHLETSCVPSDTINQHSEVEEVEETDDESIDHSEVNDVESDSISNGKFQEDDSRGAALFESDLYENMASYHNQGQEVHADEEIGGSMSSVTRNMHHLSVEDDGSPEGCVPSVVIPDHLQVQSVDCSHLSFGSFGSGINANYSSSGIVTSLPEKSNLEEPHVEADISSVGPPDSRMSEYYADDSLRNVSDGGLFHRVGVTSGSFETSSVSQPEELKPDNSEVAHGNQYPFSSPNSGYTFDDAQHLNTAFSQASSQMQSLSPFSNVMSYTNSLPSTLSAANAHPSRESDLHQYSQFPVSQALSAKYGSSSIGGPAVSLSEALKTANFSSTQPAPHSLSVSNVAGGPPLPQQHLPVHPYSQHTLPLGPFTNMIGYPFLPQSYTYMPPSAFQQTFAGNNTYHQSLAAVLPQYKNNISANNLPQSAAIASGYGALGNNTIPGNFPMNAPTAPSATALNYDDVLNSQYKEASHLISLQQQQNENSAMWLHGPNSRTMSGVPGSTYYNYQGQNHHNQGSGGFRQGQQPSQNYGALGYPNIYHSQTTTNLSLDQQPNPRDGSLGGPQGQPKQSQIWQNSY